MSREPLLSPEVFDYLRQQGITPYINLDDSARIQLGDGVRLVALHAGDMFITARAELRITVLSGRVRLEPAWLELTLDNTRERSVLTRPGENRLVAESDATLLLAEVEFLDTLSSWTELSAYVQQSGGDELMRRLLAVKHSLAFRRLPVGQVVEALSLMTPRAVKVGEIIVTQGERGDAYYLIWSGSANVWSTGLYDDEPKLVDTVGPGDAFGDEALVAGGTRNATVEMIENGELLVLGEDAFRDLILRPLIEEVHPVAAPGMIADGWTVLDVRYEEEFVDGHIPEAVLLPLPDLRQLAPDNLEPGGRYLAVCRSGKRSAVAAFLLQQRGYQVLSLQGGMNAWEGETVC